MTRKYSLGTQFADPLELEAINRLKFDDVAPIAIYHGADIRYKQKAQASLRKIKKVMPELTGYKLDDCAFMMFVYNILFQKICHEHGSETYIDKYGSFGFENKNGDVIFGDGNGQYPWYVSEKDLVGEMGASSRKIRNPMKKVAKKKRESVALTKPMIEAVLDYQKKRKGINFMTAQIAYQKLEKICNKSGIDVQDAIHFVRNMILEDPSSISKYGIDVVKFL